MVENIVSLRLSDSTKERLDRLSEAVKRPAATLASEALEAFLNEQEWQIAMIDEAVQLARDGEFVSHDAMSAWLRSWGTEEETAAPTPDIAKGRR